MQIYRFLTGEDDSAFCHKVTKALTDGWILHGSPQYAYDAGEQEDAVRPGRGPDRRRPAL